MLTQTIYVEIYTFTGRQQGLKNTPYCTHVKLSAANIPSCCNRVRARLSPPTDVAALVSSVVISGTSQAIRNSSQCTPIEHIIIT